MKDKNKKKKEPPKLSLPSEDKKTVAQCFIKALKFNIP
jgi:hypothetical protein